MGAKMREGISNRAFSIFLKDHVMQQSLRTTLKSNFDGLHHPLGYVDQHICSLGRARGACCFTE